VPLVQIESELPFELSGLSFQRALSKAKLIAQLSMLLPHVRVINSHEQVALVHSLAILDVKIAHYSIPRWRQMKHSSGDGPVGLITKERGPYLMADCGSGCEHQQANKPAPFWAFGQGRWPDNSWAS